VKRVSNTPLDNNRVFSVPLMNGLLLDSKDVDRFENMTGFLKALRLPKGCTLTKVEVFNVVLHKDPEEKDTAKQTCAKLLYSLFSNK